MNSSAFLHFIVYLYFICSFIIRINLLLLFYFSYNNNNNNNNNNEQQQ
jgi:hypothetical protein